MRLPKLIEVADVSEADLASKYGRTTAYLYWPVRLSGVNEEWTDDTLHITAKFLGETEPGKGSDPWSGLRMAVSEIIDKLARVKPHVDSSWEWKPVTFDTQNDGKVKVLELLKYDRVIAEVHEALAPLRKDNYPDFRPHITVDDHVWEIVEKEKLSPGDMHLQVGPLCLKARGTVVKTWNK